MNCSEPRSFTVKGYANTFAKIAYVFNFCKGSVHTKRLAEARLGK